MNNVMIDLETMGTNPKAPITCIGAVFFNPKTGELGERFYCRVDFGNDMLNGAVPDGDTIKWWLRQSSDARAELISDDAIPIFEAVGDLSDWLTDNAEDLKTLKVWANSPSFDCTILRSASERIGIDIPWNYWNERDVRTMKEVALSLWGCTPAIELAGAIHNALHDAINQVALVSAVMSRLARSKPEELVGCDWIDWNELSERGLLVRINNEIMHPIGLAIFRDQKTGGSGGALISHDGKWRYGKNLHEPLRNLIFSEIADFFAGLEQPNAPRSAADMQKTLLCRLEQVINARVPK